MAPSPLRGFRKRFLKMFLGRRSTGFKPFLILGGEPIRRGSSGRLWWWCSKSPGDDFPAVDVSSVSLGSTVNHEPTGISKVSGYIINEYLGADSVLSLVRGFMS
ncbi:MAG: hypothetical protein QW705_06490 [Zestosphaera sp.]